MKQGRIVVVQGGQWGSEGKGLVVAHQALVKRATAAVRTGSINAGHTVFFKGTEYKMQQIPTAWVVPGVKLYIGPGAYIEPTVLERELNWLENAGVNTKTRVFVDSRCFLHTAGAMQRAKQANRHHAMGATGKGSSEAIIEKLNARSAAKETSEIMFKNHPLAERVTLHDVPSALLAHYDAGETVVLEGTQGSLLDFHLGPHPFVTNRGCNAATWFAEAGLPPGLNTETVLVCRTFPIRVAGNSGPMGQEISWVEVLTSWINGLMDCGLSSKSHLGFTRAHVMKFAEALAHEAHKRNCPSLIDFSDWTPELAYKHRVDLSEGPTSAWLSLDEETMSALSPYIERTTVTHKIRRIAKFNMDYLREAIVYNRPTEIVLTFLNYQFPELWNETELEPHHNEWVHELSKEIGIPITWVSTAPGFDGLIRTAPSHD